MMERAHTALLLGATGLVGGLVLQLLVEDSRWSHVVTLGRGTMGPLAPSHVHHTIDFDNMGAHAEHFGCDDVFCCLGTTIKKAGSEEAFRRVDFDYPVKAAHLAHAQGATQYLLVSALGANPKSWIFYNRLKGEVEDALRGVGFASLGIFRPSLLTGERDEYRRAEAMWAIGLTLAKPLLLGPILKYRATPSKALARVMAQVATDSPQGATVYEADAIMELERETMSS